MGFSEPNFPHMGNKLREFLKRKRIRPLELAECLGKTRQHVSYLLKKERWEIRTVLDVCKAINRKPRYFLKGMD